MTHILILWLAWACSAGAAVILTPVADGDVADNGVLGFAVETTDTSLTTQSSGRDRRSIYEFDLASLPSDAFITSATLYLTLAGTLSNVGGEPATVTFSGFTGDGVITETDFPLISSVAASETFATDMTRLPIGTTVSISLTDLSSLQAASESAGRYFGIVTDTHNFATFRVNSSEADVVSGLKPQLEVQFVVPEPSRALLFLAGLVTVLARRSR